MNQRRLLIEFDRISNDPDAVARLRRFVLALAVRGKLVDQDSVDSHADHLIEQIVTTPREAPLALRYRSLVQEPIETPAFELPEQWAWTRLGLIADYVQRGKSPEYSLTPGALVVSQKCVRWEGLDLAPARSITSKCLDTFEPIRYLRDGDLLWNSTGTGTIGRLSRVIAPPDRLVCDSHVTIVRCSQLDPEFIRCWLRSDYVYGTIEGEASGSTNQVELTLQRALSQPVPLPPLAEQHRIVDRVDELMALCDQLETAQKDRESQRSALRAASLNRLTTAKKGGGAESDIRFFLNSSSRLITTPEHVDAVRQVVLDLAVRGRLVAQDPNDEPASELLCRLRAANGSLPARFNSQTEPIDLPMGWQWVRFPELGVFGRGKSKHRPRNDPILYASGTYPFIQTGDVARSGGLIRTFTTMYNDTGLAQSQMWPAGTLCITIAANIADSGILTFDACFPDSVVGLIVSSELPNCRYFEYFLRTAKADLFSFAPSTAQKNINLSILSDVLIPLPPLEELKRIVARIDELMGVCDELQTALKSARHEQGRLLEAVLQEALLETTGHPALAR